MARKTERIEGGNQSEHFTYCGIRKCIHTECLRHHINTPWDVLIYRKDFKPDRDWNCKDMILER